MYLEEVRAQLIDLYLYIKVRNSEDIKNLTQDHLNKERKSLKNLPIFDIINYIQNSIDVLVELKLLEKMKEQLKLEESKKSFKNLEDPNDLNGLKLYEGMLIDAEKKIRNHIRVRTNILFINILQNNNLLIFRMNKN